MRSICLPGLFSFWILWQCAPFVSAATYYIDYNAGNDANPGTRDAPWKLAPGMRGFAGLSAAQPGDEYILKGGVIWTSSTLPLTINSSGNAFAPISWTTDQTWFSGSAWSQPMLDGASTVTSAVVANGRSYFTINDLRIVNIGAPQTANSKKALDLRNCDHLTISNLTLKPETWLGIYVYISSIGVTRSGVIITGNDISSCGQGIVVATAAFNAIYDDIDISHNTIHDFSSQIGGGVHGDGIHTWGSTTDNSQYLTNLRIHDNLFYGSFYQTFGPTGAMTAFIYVSDATEGALIYNNAGTYNFTGASQFEALISLRGNNGRGGHHQIFNNSFQGSVPSISVAFLVGGGSVSPVPGCTIQNNILSGMKYAYLIGSGSDTGLSIDYNLINVTSSVAQYLGSFMSWTQWQALGFDLNSIRDDPQFVSITNLHLLDTSPAIGKGINLNDFFLKDLAGMYRPASAPWDMGSYQHQQLSAASNAWLRLADRPAAQN